jgi:uncharacterized membrane protein
MNFSIISSLALLLKLDVAFPMTGGQLEQIVLRWMHIIAGIMWIGLLYYLNLVGTPSMKEFESKTRVQVIAVMMPRAMWWLRWSSVVVWVAGFRYFMILAQTDAAAIGIPAAAGRWLVEWFVCWAVASVLIVGVMQMSAGPLKSGWLVAAIVTAILVAASWVDLAMLAVPGAGNRTLSISLGGGLGTILMFLVWGLVWRFQKKIIKWAEANKNGSGDVPADVQKLMRGSFMAGRTAFWISFPMIFLMAAASHYPFLSGI